LSNMLQTNVILAPGDNIFQSIVLLALSLPHCCSIRQIYCPLDEPSSAFHRCLYLFCCHQNQCIQNGRSYPPPLHPPINLLSRSISSLSISSLSLCLSSLLCLRSQLPKENDFYSLDPTQSLSDTPLTVASADVPLCLVCGSQLRIPSPPPLAPLLIHLSPVSSLQLSRELSVWEMSSGVILFKRSSETGLESSQDSLWQKRCSTLRASSSPERELSSFPFLQSRD
jgi:hypothetical protein